MRTYLFMKPYPLFTLNHFTVPVIFFAENDTEAFKGSQNPRVGRAKLQHVPLLTNSRAYSTFRRVIHL